MSADPIPQDLEAVHDLVDEALEVANRKGGSFPYALALFPRTSRFGARVFGVATSGGESTTLTYRMLQSLAQVATSIAGVVPARLWAGGVYGGVLEVSEALQDQPVLRLGFTCAIGQTRDQASRSMPLELSLFVGDLTAPLVLLTDQRPAGWPG